MAIDHRVGNKVVKNLRREEATGTRVDPYPYIGIVKNNLDPTRSGRLSVYIPDLGGFPDDPNNWRTVSYASPYQGYTSQKQSATDNPSTANKFDTVSHTYGMWAVPPDTGVQVIVLFIAGDPLRGYWLACVNPNLSHYMLPAMGGTPNVDPTSLSVSEQKSYLTGNINLPVVEFNEYLGGDVLSSTFYNNNKPVHKYQFETLKLQGLDKDPIRGSISSSSQRESPSHVFGISTPGRPVADPADDKQTYVNSLNAGTIDPKYLTTKSRKGGHQFVMDDGATLGEDQLVRLRTAKGHQLLLHDTDNSIYLGHADGTSWIEMTPDGSINVYAQGGYNLRSEGTINLHSDSDLNINAVGDVKINAGGKFIVNSTSTELLQSSLVIESRGKITIKAGGDFLTQATSMFSIKAGDKFAMDAGSNAQLSGQSKDITTLKAMNPNKLSDTVDAGGVWNSKPAALSSIVTVAPTHEPYFRNAVATAFIPASAGIQPEAAYQGAVDATKSINTSTGGVQNPAGDTDLRNQPPCDCKIGNLSKDQLTAYFAQIGKSESGGKYNTVNSIGFAGKYQFGFGALVDGGYAKTSVNSNAQLRNPNSWTGKNGIDSLEAWLNNGAEQEAAMCAYTKRNYSTMCRIGALTQDQPPEDVAGMLAVSHLLGPGGAKKFRNGASGADQYGTTGATYFNKGKYAVAVLAPKLPTIDAG